MYTRKQGDDSKFTKVKGGIWVGRGWSLAQVRHFLVESKDNDGTAAQFNWLPLKFSFFHPDTETAIAIDMEETVSWSDFIKAFIALEGLQYKKTRTESVASDVSIEANTLMFEVNATFEAYPDRLAEFTQVLDAFGKDEITRPELKWAVKQLCENVDGGRLVLDLFLEHLPDDDYELILDSPIEQAASAAASSTMATASLETVADHVYGGNDTDTDNDNDNDNDNDSDKSSPPSKTKRKSKHKRKRKSSKSKSKSKSRSNTVSSSRSSSREFSPVPSSKEPDEVRRIMSDPPKDFHNSGRNTMSEPTTLARSSSVGNTRRPKSPQDERDVEIARRRGQELLFDKGCFSVVADVVSYTVVRPTSFSNPTVEYVVQVLAMDEHGNAIERWTVQREFSEFQALHANVAPCVKSHHRPLSSMADVHYMITRLSSLNTSKILLEQRLKCLSSYLKSVVMTVQAVAVQNQKQEETRSAYSSVSTASTACHVNRAGAMWLELATFLSVQKPSHQSNKYGGDLCCECRQSCRCCRGCISGAMMIWIVLFLPALSTVVSTLYPAAVGFDDPRLTNTVVSELRVSWLVGAVRDAIAFVVLGLIALFVEGCSNGCGRVLTAGWKSPASPLLHLAAVFLLSVLFVGWHTSFVLGTQYVMPPVGAPTTTAGGVFVLPDAKHHVFISSALGLVPLLYFILRIVVNAVGGMGGGSGGGGGGGGRSGYFSLFSNNKLSGCSLCCVSTGLILISTIGIVVISTSFDINMPCYTNVTSNVSQMNVAAVQATAPSSRPPFVSTCLYEGFIFLCTSSFCLASYIIVLRNYIYNQPTRTFRVFSTTAWTAGCGCMTSILVLLAGSASVEGGLAAIVQDLPPYDDMLWYGVLPGVVSVVGSYLMLPWLIMNTSGSVTASVYGLPFVYSVVVCAIGFKWEKKNGSLTYMDSLYAGLSLLGVCIVIIPRMKHWWSHDTTLSFGNGLDADLLSNDAAITSRTGLLGDGSAGGAGGRSGGRNSKSKSSRNGSRTSYGTRV